MKRLSLKKKMFPRNNPVPFFSALRYFLTKNSRTEEFYKLQYKKFLKKYFCKEKNSLAFENIFLPLLSTEKNPTREEAYYAMEIGDILLPAVFKNFWYIDEGPYEFGNIFVNSDDVVFDCGAHLGIFSLIAAARGAKVYAFEPIEETRAALQRTLSMNSELAKKITIVPYALGSEEGSSKFTVLDGTLVGSSMVLPQAGRKVSVKMTTIDSFVEHEKVVPTFIKADIEGAERLMLTGAKNTLRNFSPKISVCTYHLPDDCEVIEELLLEGNPNYLLTHKWKKVYGYVPEKSE